MSTSLSLPGANLPAGFTGQKASSTEPDRIPSTAFDSRVRFRRLAQDLAAALASTNCRARWKEPPVFFFDARRQAALEAARTRAPETDPFAGLATRIAEELPALFASVEMRQTARAVEGLRHAAEAMAQLCPGARDLADILAVPDDEVVIVLYPALRIGLRFVVRGVADAGQFHVLLADAANEVLPASQVAPRFVSAYRDAGVTFPAGVPMVAEARLQMYSPDALETDGTLPEGFGGSDHWFWPHTPLADVPRLEGERTILLGPAPYHITWEVSRRFPALAADVQLVEVLSPFRVAERVGRLTGHHVPARVPEEPKHNVAKAA